MPSHILCGFCPSFPTCVPPYNNHYSVCLFCWLVIRSDYSMAWWLIQYLQILLVLTDGVATPLPWFWLHDILIVLPAFPSAILFPFILCLLDNQRAMMTVTVCLFYHHWYLDGWYVLLLQRALLLTPFWLLSVWYSANLLFPGPYLPHSFCIHYRHVILYHTYTLYKFGDDIRPIYIHYQYAYMMTMCVVWWWWYELLICYYCVDVIILPDTTIPPVWASSSQMAIPSPDDACYHPFGGEHIKPNDDMYTRAASQPPYTVVLLVRRLHVLPRLPGGCWPSGPGCSVRCPIEEVFTMYSYSVMMMKWEGVMPTRILTCCIIDTGYYWLLLLLTVMMITHPVVPWACYPDLPWACDLPSHTYTHPHTHTRPPPLPTLFCYTTPAMTCDDTVHLGWWCLVHCYCVWHWWCLVTISYTVGTAADRRLPPNTLPAGSWFIDMIHYYLPAGPFNPTYCYRCQYMTEHLPDLYYHHPITPITFWTGTDTWCHHFQWRWTIDDYRWRHCVFVILLPIPVVKHAAWLFRYHYLRVGWLVPTCCSLVPAIYSEERKSGSTYHHTNDGCCWQCFRYMVWPLFWWHCTFPQPTCYLVLWRLCYLVGSPPTIIGGTVIPCHWRLPYLMIPAALWLMMEGYRGVPIVWYSPPPPVCDLGDDLPFGGSYSPTFPLLPNLTHAPPWRYIIPCRGWEEGDICSDDSSLQHRPACTIILFIMPPTCLGDVMVTFPLVPLPHPLPFTTLLPPPQPRYLVLFLPLTPSPAPRWERKNVIPPYLLTVLFLPTPIMIPVFWFSLACDLQLPLPSHYLLYSDYW